MRAPLIAAAHAFDRAPTVIEILVADPIEGRNRAQLRRGGDTVLSFGIAKGRLLEPTQRFGMLSKVRNWIESLIQKPNRPRLRWGEPRWRMAHAVARPGMLGRPDVEPKPLHVSAAPSEGSQAHRGDARFQPRDGAAARASPSRRRTSWI